MSAPGWMPLHVAEYVADTTHLSTAEHGAYLLLIMHYWQNRGLPADDAKLARICRMSRDEFAESRETLAGFFADGWVHKRIDAELAKADEKYEKRASAGRKGGIAKSVASNATAMPEQCSTNNTDIDIIEEDNKAIALSSDRSEADVAAMVEIYHQAGAGIWPKVAKLNPSRKAKCRRRLLDCGGLSGWQEAMTRARASPFLTGDNPRGWRPGFDFFLQAESFTKLLEGSYDARKPSGTAGQPRPLTGSSALLAAARSRLGPIPDGSGGEAGLPLGIDAQRDGSGVYRLADRGH